MTHITLNADPTSIGILVAALALWSQLWVKYSTQEPLNNIPVSEKRRIQRQRVVSVGLAWIYTAILLSVIAFLIVVSNPQKLFIFKFGQVLFLSSLIMGLFNIGESTVTLYWKMLHGKTHDELVSITDVGFYVVMTKIILIMAFCIFVGAFFAVYLSLYLGILVWLAALLLAVLLYFRIKNDTEWSN